MGLINHVKTEHLETTHACISCGARFIHESNLSKHLMNAHVNNADDLLINAQHNLIKEGFEKFSDSPKYQEQFSNDPYLIKHPNAFRQGHEFSCDYCFSTFTKRAKLERHQRKYHVGQNKKYPCSQCSKVFVNKANVTRHHLDKHVKIKEERVHPKIRKLIEKPKANEESGKPNIKEESENLKDKKYPCSECSQMFLRLGNVKRHFDLKHAKINTESKKLNLKINTESKKPNLSGSKKKFPCNECSRVFSQVGFLERHKKFRHQEPVG